MMCTRSTTEYVSLPTHGIEQVKLIDCTYGRASASSVSARKVGAHVLNVVQAPDQDPAKHAELL